MAPPKIEFLRNTICPVCGKPTVAVIDHVGTLPIAICLVCDTRRMEEETGYSPLRLRWLRLRNYFTVQTDLGRTGALLCFLGAMALPSSALLYPVNEVLSGAVMLAGMAAIWGVFTLYILPILFRPTDLAYYDDHAETDQEPPEGERHG